MFLLKLSTNISAVDMFHQILLAVVSGFCLLSEVEPSLDFETINLKETKRELISLIKTNHISKTKNESSKIIIKQHTGIHIIEFHSVLNALYDLLHYWGLKPMTFIIEPETGFSHNKIVHYFDQRSQTILVHILKFNETQCSILNKFRYFVYIGHWHMHAIFKSMSQCPMLFMSMRTWIIIAEYDAIDYFKSSDLGYFVNSTWSQITFFVPQHSSASLHASHSMYINYGMAPKVDLYDIFYSPSTLKTEVIPFGYWTPKLRLYFFRKIQDDQGLRGRIVRVTSIREICPIVCYDKVNTSQFIPSYGADLIFGLEKPLNAKHFNNILEGGGFGIASPNGSFNGFIGQLQRGEADISMVVCSVTEERQVLALRYSEIGVIGDMRITIKQPLPLVPPTIYFLPFQVFVWIITLSTLILTITIMLLMHKFYQTKNSKLGHRKKLPQYPQNNKRKIKLDFFDQDDINGLAEAIVMLTLYMAAFMIYTYYTSILTAVFAYRDIKLPFKNIEELANRHDYTMITVKDTIYQKYFENAKDGPYQSIWKKFLANNKKGLVSDFISAFDIVAKNDKHAYFTAGLIFQSWVKKQCNLMYHPEKYMKGSFNLSFRKDFPFFKIYSSSMWRLYQGGIFNRLEKTHLSSDYGKCEDLGVSQTLELDQIYLLFVFLLISFAMAIAALLIEIVYHSNKHRLQFPIKINRKI